MRVVVLGAGAIGASVGALLHEAGVPVVLVARGEHGRALQGGVELRFPDSHRRVRVPCVSSLSQVAPTPEDLVLIATMGHHTAEAVAELSAQVPVVSLQNGLLPQAMLAERGHRTLAAMVWMPAERRAPGQIALPSVPVPGSFLLGRWPSGDDPLADWLVQQLQRAGFRAELEPDIVPWLRAKLLTNLSGIVSALCDDPPQDVVQAAQQEAREVWRAAGQPFVEIEALRERMGPGRSLPVDGTIRKGGSTRGALARGEPLETEALHGGIVQAGRELQIPTPVNEALLALAQIATAPGQLSADALRSGIDRLSVSRVGATSEGEAAWPTSPGFRTSR